MLVVLAVIVIVSVVYLQQRSSALEHSESSDSSVATLEDSIDTARITTEDQAAVDAQENPDSVLGAGSVSREPFAAAPQKPTVDTAASTQATGRYTLIVGSVESEHDAILGLQVYERLGYTTRILPFHSGDHGGFRMALGSFPSISKADSMRTVLQNELPPGTWVWRLK